MLKFAIYACLALCMAISCQPKADLNSFASDLNFLKKHTECHVLKNKDDQGQIVVVPAYQARVMTSTTTGPNGLSLGWINKPQIASNTFGKQITVYGGEDRFWLGPEGGQFSLFFKKPQPFKFKYWKTPAPIDTLPYAIKALNDTMIRCEATFSVKNYQGFLFSLHIDRQIKLLNKKQIFALLKTPITDLVNVVAYASINTVTNVGPVAWTKQNGLPSIWILGMMRPSNQNTIILPYKDSLNLTTEYFGSIPPNRLTHQNGKAVFLKADGKHRGKIGLPFKNATGWCGAFDAQNNVLTLVNYTLNPNKPDYVNSLWKMQAKPFNGDVVNAYNDGPLENGEQLGPFFELESSSAALDLAPQQAYTHIHTTLHLQGPTTALNQIAHQVLGVTVAQ